MGRVRDIACPSCGRTETLEKRTLDRYRCRECGAEFSPADVVSTEDG
jgi:ribosomal protein L37AE/L43A